MVQPLYDKFEQVGQKRIGGNRGGLPQKYVLTDRGRAMIIAEYNGTKAVIDDLAERLNVPRWTVKKWGQQLGLARKKEPFWTPEDEHFLESHLHKMSIRDIAIYLGRTQTAVRLKAKRIGVNKTQEGYTMRGLCMGLGCDHHKVEKWIACGWLQGQRRGIDRPQGDFWLFTDADIRNFILAHPLEIDARRMDWLWVVDLLSDNVGSLASSLNSQSDEDPAQELLEGQMDLDTKHQLHLDIDMMASTSMALLGISRSGKTNTAFVILEELLVNGTPMTIVDIEGEYWTLTKQFDMPIYGRAEYCVDNITVENAADIAHASMVNGTPVILDFSEYDDMEECHAILYKYMAAIWTAGRKMQRPYQIVLEEAHEWIPEGAKTPEKEILTRIALRGLKRGLAMMVISQRSAKVSKDILTQIALLFLHRVVHAADMNTYKDVIPLAGGMVTRTVSELKVGQAVVIHDHVPRVVQIRQYGGTEVQPDTKMVLSNRVKELEALLREQDEIIKDQAHAIAYVQQQKEVAS
jgi:hypothetical protein